VAQVFGVDVWVILLSTFVFLMAVRMPMAVAMLLSAVITMAIQGGISVLMVVQRLFAGTDSFVLMAIPFFMVAGVVMDNGGITKRIVAFANSLVGMFPGGLAAVNIVASMIFGGISGSASAEASALGSLMIPAMEQQGYKKSFASAVVASSSPIGMIIPPSIPMVLYSFVSGESLGALFLGGIIPGIVIGCVLIGLSTYISAKRGYKGSATRFDLKEVLRTSKDGILALLAPAIIIGGIVGGFFTPTEASVVAVAYSLILAIGVYHDLKWSDLPKVLIKAGRSTALVMFITAAAGALSFVLTINDIPQAISAGMMEVAKTPGMFMLLSCILLFILGMFLDVSVIVLLVTPILAPLVIHFGLNPIHAAMIFMIMLAVGLITPPVGLITPPVGLCLFVASGISGLTLEKIAKEALPFIVGMLIVALLVWWFPALATYIPGLLAH
jgi:tripartite ATP-independent transporter DctM subunit